MKIGRVRLKNYKYELEFPISEKDFRNQISDIFANEHYKEGRKKGVIVDLGANVGIAALYLRKYADIVHSVEPSPEVYKSLVKNVSKYKNIKTYNLAITNSDGESYIYGYGEEPPQTLFPSGSGISRNLVRTKRLDTFFKENNIDHVDVLKMDVEGSEFVIFPSQGFAKVADKIDMIVGESHFNDKNGAFIEVIPQMLKEYGFKTKFKKQKNCIRFLEYTSPEGKHKKYKVKFNTLFVARR